MLRVRADIFSLIFSRGFRTLSQGPGQSSEAHYGCEATIKGVRTLYFFALIQGSPEYIAPHP